MKHRWTAAKAALVALVLAAAAPGAEAKPPFRPAPASGRTAYVYEVREITPQGDRSYRTAYDLDWRGGGVVAIARKLEAGRNGDWREVVPDAACRKALGARPGEIARTRLWPMTAERATLGEAYMADCAPGALFFPMTDILNVVLIQTSPQFAVRKLSKVGDAVRHGPFATAFSREGTAIDAASPGGETRLVALDGDIARVRWTPEPMRLTIVNRGAMQGKDLTLKGYETFAFELEIDRRTGVLQRARTLFDNLDMKMELPGAPAERWPAAKIRREVEIRRL